MGNVVCDVTFFLTKLKIVVIMDLIVEAKVTNVYVLNLSWDRT